MKVLGSFFDHASFCSGDWTVKVPVFGCPTQNAPDLFGPECRWLVKWGRRGPMLPPRTHEQVTAAATLCPNEGHNQLLTVLIGWAISGYALSGPPFRDLFSMGGPTGDKATGIWMSWAK